MFSDFGDCYRIYRACELVYDYPIFKWPKLFIKLRDNFGLVVVGGHLYAVGGSVTIGSQVCGINMRIMTMLLMMMTMMLVITFYTLV